MTGPVPAVRPAGRPGPRPMPLHLGMETLLWIGSLAALPVWKSGWLAWSPALVEAAKVLSRDLDGADPEAFARAVDAEGRKRLAAFADGVLLYRRHEREPRPPEPAPAWRRGSARLLDYGGGDGAGAGPVLLVPSLVNRAYILDLDRRRSLARSLAAAGFRTYLLDWGAPAGRERGFGLTEYVRDYLEDALQAVVEAAGRPAGVVGYCMGGLLALALAQRRPDRVAALALLATPWDFHAMEASRVRLIRAMGTGLEALLDHLGVLPVDVLQAMFSGLDPFLTPTKFERFAAARPGSAPAKAFVQLEDWLNDGVALAGPVARECLFGWYVDNGPRHGRWRIDNRPVRPAEVRAPALVVVPEKDRIVPPESAAALADELPDAERWTLRSGHIGMVAGRAAPEILYEPLARWLGAAMR